VRLVDVLQVYFRGYEGGRQARRKIFVPWADWLGQNAHRGSSCGNSYLVTRAPSSRWTARNCQHSHEIAKLIGSPSGISGAFGRRTL